MYDTANRIKQFTSPDGTSIYTYDETDQLTGSDHSFQTDEAYNYDNNGNRTNTSYVTGSNNQLLSDGTYNYEYDGEGNRTKRTSIATGEVTEYTWDYRNRLTQVVVKDANGNSIKEVEYTYDIFDRRIAKEVDPDGALSANATVERIVYDSDDIALTFDGNGNQTHRYLHGPGIDQILAEENASGEVLWALTDNQGTVRDVIDSTGTIQNHITYDSFGQVTGETNPSVDFRFGYTGREFDEETGQYYYRARYYDPKVGEFISEDPIGFAAGDTNLYQYVNNSPTNFTDPSGNGPRGAAIGAGIGGIFGGVGGATVGGGGGTLALPGGGTVGGGVTGWQLGAAGGAAVGGLIGDKVEDLIRDYFPSQPHDNSDSQEANPPQTIDGTEVDTGNCNPQPPDCKPDFGFDPVEEITEEFLDNLIQEALDFQGKLDERESSGRTVAVAQVRDQFGNREIVVTTNIGAFTNAQNELAKERGYTQVRTGDGLGKGWHAEGRLIEWAFRKNKTIEAMGVSRKLCPDCAQDVDLNGIQTNNLRYGDDYFKQNPNRRPKKRPQKC